MTDPASLNVSIGFEGLDRHEAAIVIEALPLGRTATVVKIDGVIGMPRHHIRAAELSTGQAHVMISEILAGFEKRTAGLEAKYPSGPQ